MVSTHPEISWSVVLRASLNEAVPTEDVAERIRAGFEARPELGLIPEAQSFHSTAGAASDLAANMPFGPGDPLVRILSMEDPPHLILATHHAILDGLGLLALLGTALGSKVETDVRGLPAERQGRRGFFTTALRRLSEALVALPARVASADGDAQASGDWLLSRAQDGPPPGTAALAAAVARAVRAWNGSHSESADRIVLAVGASVRPGSDLQPENRSAYLRVHADTGDASALAAAIKAAPIESEDEPAPGLRRVTLISRPIVRLASSRLGSTALVSSLGRVSAPPIVREIHFFPVAHGRSAMTVGMSGLGDRTVLTLRCGRTRFSEKAAEQLADAIVTELDGSLRPG